jgi:hypothetical protein
MFALRPEELKALRNGTPWPKSLVRMAIFTGVMMTAMWLFLMIGAVRMLLMMEP